MKKKLLIVLIVMAMIFANVSPTIVQAQETERFVTITLHVGENGYFETQEETEKESIQFYGETFQERATPNNTNPEMMFLGWATTPDATYYYEKGKNSTWEKDSKDGLEFIIKRNTEDEEA